MLHLIPVELVIKICEHLDAEPWSPRPLLSLRATCRSLWASVPAPHVDPTHTRISYTARTPFHGWYDRFEYFYVTVLPSGIATTAFLMVHTRPSGPTAASNSNSIHILHLLLLTPHFASTILRRVILDRQILPDGWGTAFSRGAANSAMLEILPDAIRHALYSSTQIRLELRRRLVRSSDTIPYHDFTTHGLIRLMHEHVEAFGMSVWDLSDGVDGDSGWRRLRLERAVTVDEIGLPFRGDAIERVWGIEKGLKYAKIQLAEKGVLDLEQGLLISLADDQDSEEENILGTANSRRDMSAEVQLLNPWI